MTFGYLIASVIAALASSNEVVESTAIADWSKLLTLISGVDGAESIVETLNSVSEGKRDLVQEAILSVIGEEAESIAVLLPKRFDEVMSEEATTELDEHDECESEKSVLLVFDTTNTVRTFESKAETVFENIESIESVKCNHYTKTARLSLATESSIEQETDLIRLALKEGGFDAVFDIKDSVKETIGQCYSLGGLTAQALSEVKEHLSTNVYVRAVIDSSDKLLVGFAENYTNANAEEFCKSTMERFGGYGLTPESISNRQLFEAMDSDGIYTYDYFFSFPDEVSAKRFMGMARSAGSREVARRGNIVGVMGPANKEALDRAVQALLGNTASYEEWEYFVRIHIKESSILKVAQSIISGEYNFADSMKLFEMAKDSDSIEHAVATKALSYSVERAAETLSSFVNYLDTLYEGDLMDTPLKPNEQDSSTIAGRTTLSVRFINGMKSVSTDEEAVQKFADNMIAAEYATAATVLSDGDDVMLSFENARRDIIVGYFLPDFAIDFEVQTDGSGEFDDVPVTESGLDEAELRMKKSGEKTTFVIGLRYSSRDDAMGIEAKVDIDKLLKYLKNIGGATGVVTSISEPYLNTKTRGNFKRVEFRVTIDGNEKQGHRVIAKAISDSGMSNNTEFIREAIRTRRGYQVSRLTVIFESKDKKNTEAVAKSQVEATNFAKEARKQTTIYDKVGGVEANKDRTSWHVSIAAYGDHKAVEKAVNKTLKSLGVTEACVENADVLVDESKASEKVELQKAFGKLHNSKYEYVVLVSNFDDSELDISEVNDIAVGMGFKPMSQTKHWIMYPARNKSHGDKLATFLRRTQKYSATVFKPNPDKSVIGVSLESVNKDTDNLDEARGTGQLTPRVTELLAPCYGVVVTGDKKALKQVSDAAEKHKKIMDVFHIGVGTVRIVAKPAVKRNEVMAIANKIVSNLKLGESVTVNESCTDESEFDESKASEKLALQKALGDIHRSGRTAVVMVSGLGNARLDMPELKKIARSETFSFVSWDKDWAFLSAKDKAQAQKYAQILRDTGMFAATGMRVSDAPSLIGVSLESVDEAFVRDKAMDRKISDLGNPKNAGDLEQLANKGNRESLLLLRYWMELLASTKTVAQLKKEHSVIRSQFKSLFADADKETNSVTSLNLLKRAGDELEKGSIWLQAIEIKKAGLV